MCLQAVWLSAASVKSEYVFSSGTEMQTQEAEVYATMCEW